MDNALQRTDEWFRSRIGYPTASQFGKILSPTGKRSSQSEAYMNSILAVWLLGYDPEIESEGELTPWMQRGIDTEAEARFWFEAETGIDVTEVGFILNASIGAGCSPDGLIGDLGGLEIKCPKHSTHVGYLLKGGLPLTYRPQVQGSMWITDRHSWHFVSYHPELPKLVYEVKRDDEYINTLANEITLFNQKLQHRMDTLRERGYKNAIPS